MHVWNSRQAPRGEACRVPDRAKSGLCRPPHGGPKACRKISVTFSLRSNSITGMQDHVSEIEFAQFADQTISLTPEPSAMGLVAVSLAGLAIRRRGRSRLATGADRRQVRITDRGSRRRN
jgi:hypothetical protein